MDANPIINSIFEAIEDDNLFAARDTAQELEDLINSGEPLETQVKLSRKQVLILCSMIWRI